MKKFKTLFLMQMRERVDLSFLKDKKQTMFKVVFGALYFICLVAISYLVLSLAQTFHIFSPLNHIPLSVMAVLLFIMFLFNLVSCTSTLTNSLYFSKDNQVLITFPASPNILFLSKISVHFVYELKKTFTFIVPVFIAYGIVSGIGIFYYFWLVFMMILFSAFIVLLAGLLSIPMIVIRSFFEKYNYVRIILLAILLGLLVWGVIALLNKIPQDIDLIKSWAKISSAIDTFLAWFVKYFSPMYYFSLCLCGTYKNFTSVLFTKYMYIGFLILLTCILLLFVINYYVSRPIYLKLISTKFEFGKSVKINKPNKIHKSKYSTFIYETTKDLRNGELVRTTITLFVIAPILILTLDKIYAAINTALFGTNLTIAFNILIILLFVLSHNISASSVFSRDGESLYMLKTMPKSPINLLFSRLGYYAISSAILITMMLSIFWSFTSVNWFDAILMFLSILMYALTHIVISAEIDFLHPRMAMFRTEGKASKNPNEIKSTILAFALSFVFFGIVLFFYVKDTNLLWLKLFLLTGSVLALRVYLFCYKAKILFREVL